MVSQGNKVVNQDNKVVNQGNKVVSQGNKVVSQNNKVVSQDNKVVSQDNKVVSQDNKVVSQDNKVVPDLKSTLLSRFKTSWGNKVCYELNQDEKENIVVPRAIMFVIKLKWEILRAQHWLIIIAWSPAYFKPENSVKNFSFKNVNDLLDILWGQSFNKVKIQGKMGLSEWRGVE